MNHPNYHLTVDGNILEACQLQTLEFAQSCPDAQLRQLLLYHLQDVGSQTRAKLAIASSLALSLATNVCASIATTCELLHNASLLIDDVQDQDTTRRGKSAAWVQFDPNTAICAGTYLISAAYVAISRIKPQSADLIAHTHRRIANLIAGQVQDLRHAEQPADMASYVQIAMQKSGSLLALPLEIALIAAQQTNFVATATKAGEHFAVAYQIVDDLHDLEADAAKGGCNLIHMLSQSSGNLDAATQQAMALARHHLAACLECAEQLPLQCGAYLQALCQQLAAKHDDRELTH